MFTMINTIKFIFPSDEALDGNKYNEPLKISLKKNLSNIFHNAFKDIIISKKNKEDVIKTYQNNSLIITNESTFKNYTEGNYSDLDGTDILSEFGVNSTKTEESIGTTINNDSSLNNYSEDDFSDLEETGIVSGRVLNDDILLRPVYNASVFVNGEPADIYGTTYLALNVSVGKVIVEAYDNEGKTINESLTVESSVVNSVDLIFPSIEEGIPPDVTLESNYLEFSWVNRMSLKLNITGDRIFGIEDVKIDGVPLRNSSLTGLPEIIKIKNGSFVRIYYRKCQFINYETKGKVVIVHSKLLTQDGDIELDWIFTPWNMTVEGNQYKGLGYRFSISSPIIISKMEFQCSWELNKSVIGKTLLTRQNNIPWKIDCTQEALIINETSLFSLSQPFVYQYDDSGVLATFIWPPSELDNIMQKNEDSEQLWFYDKFSFGEIKQAETPFRVVMYSALGGLDEYTYLFDQISQNYREFYGLVEVEPIPTVLANRYLQPMTLGEAPDYRNLADNWLQKFMDLNFKQMLIKYVWLSNGRLGDPYNNNRLATHYIEIHPDDKENLKYLIDKTHALNMKFLTWLSTCFSKQSQLYETNEWQTINVDGSYPGAPSEDVYLMSYRSGFLAYSIERLKELKEEFGFDGIWNDFFFTGAKLDYSDIHIKPPIDQQIQYLSVTQKAGYSHYTEALGPFGMIGTGSAAITPPGSPHGDRDIKAAFGGNEYLAYKTSFALFHPDDFYPLQVDYYKFLANKAVPMLSYQYLNETEKEILSTANNDYNTAIQYMDKRHILPDERGIIWYDKESNTKVLFAYNEFTYDLEENITMVYDITNNSFVEIINGCFTTQIKHTYKLQ